MLEATKFQSTENFCPFLGAPADVYRGNYDGQITSAYTKYVDVVNLIFKTFRRLDWTETEPYE